MNYRTRINYSEEQKSLMWDRWQKGESMHPIARLFDRGHSSIPGVLSAHGGIRPASRKRSAQSQFMMPEIERHGMPKPSRNTCYCADSWLK